MCVCVYTGLSPFSSPAIFCDDNVVPTMRPSADKHRSALDSESLRKYAGLTVSKQTDLYKGLASEYINNEAVI